MDQKQLNIYAQQGFNRVPVSTVVSADIETPVSCYLKLANTPYSYLFESVEGGEKWSRFSIIGLACRTIVRVLGYQVSIERDGEIISQETVQDPLAWIETFQQSLKVPVIEGLPPYHGGLVGYFAYDIVRYIEPRLNHWQKPDTIGTPDILLMVSEDILVFDNLYSKIHLITHVDPSQVNALQYGQEKLNQIKRQLKQPVPQAAPTANSNALSFESNIAKNDYLANIEKIKEYIKAGDTMQVVYSQRLSMPFNAAPISLYRSLRSLNPSPYLYYLNLKHFHIVGSSPEILVRVEDEKVTVRPLAGTRKRGKTTAEDKGLEKELLADPKELAEHLMLIDLGRNDVGKVSANGSVEVTEKMNIERYSHVMHIVSEVQGHLKSGMSSLEALQSALPAGTLSGAPKSRAMEIIDEIETEKRGIYGGAVGYLSWHGNIDTAIAIRTAVIKNNTLHIQAGGGIVHDSVPEDEWQESMNKAKAILNAAELVLQEDNE